MQTIPAAAQTAHYAAHLNDLHTRLADVSTWADSPRKAALVADYERQIAEYEVMIEVGAELAEASDEAVIAEEPEDEQAAELDGAMQLASVRQGWAMSYNAKLMILTMWHGNGARLSATACWPSGWLIAVEHNAIAARNRGVADGKLCDALIEEMRGLEALKPSVRPLVILADAFPY